MTLVFSKTLIFLFSDNFLKCGALAYIIPLSVNAARAYLIIDINPKGFSYEASRILHHRLILWQ